VAGVASHLTPPSKYTYMQASNPPRANRRRAEGEADRRIGWKDPARFLVRNELATSQKLLGIYRLSVAHDHVITGRVIPQVWDGVRG
jgi:hypothetical protein